MGTKKNQGLIVVVDDDTGVRELTKMTLEHFGYEVKDASDGAIALNLIADLCNNGCQPDLIVTDVDMPHVDGVQMARELAMDSMRSRIPILFVSGDLQGYSLADLEPYGGNLLQKPVEFADLQKMLNHILFGLSKTPAS